MFHIAWSYKNWLIGEKPMEYLSIAKNIKQVIFTKSPKFEKTPHKVLQRNCSCPQYSRTPTVSALVFDSPHLPSLQGPLGLIWMHHLPQILHLNLRRLSHTPRDLLLHLRQRRKENRTCLFLYTLCNSWGEKECTFKTIKITSTLHYCPLGYLDNNLGYYNNRGNLWLKVACTRVSSATKYDCVDTYIHFPWYFSTDDQ